MRYYIVSYTNKVKSYCQDEFLATYGAILEGHEGIVVDNTNDGGEYAKQLRKHLKHVVHINVPQEPAESKFQRNVTESVNLCRREFLKSDADIMVIIESDVIPPKDLITRLDESIIHLSQAESFHYKPWGIIGGLYYVGFHDFTLEGLQDTHHVLSGCTAYKRELVKKHKFRYDPNDLGPFPDALMSFDAGKHYSLWNDHSIICQHLEVSPGCRQV